jgi:hypothetical protein
LEELHVQNIAHGNINPTTLHLPIKEGLRHASISLSVDDMKQFSGDKFMSINKQRDSRFASIG